MRDWRIARPVLPHDTLTQKKNRNLGTQIPNDSAVDTVADLRRRVSLANFILLIWQQLNSPNFCCRGAWKQNFTEIRCVYISQTDALSYYEFIYVFYAKFGLKWLSFVYIAGNSIWKTVWEFALFTFEIFRAGHLATLIERPSILPVM
jgi:hypothetical protein